MKTVKVIAVLDRFEGEKAILLLGDDSKHAMWPREALPEGSSEGQIFSFTIEVDKMATELARREVEELMREIIAENEAGKKSE
jgi:hypothetical protein